MNCLVCNKTLIGQQKSYCSKKCSKKMRLKRWLDKNPDYMKIKKKEWDVNNSIHKSEYRNKYRTNHLEHKKLTERMFQSKRRELYHTKHKFDIQFKIKQSARSRIYDVLKGKSKSLSTMDLIGCTIEELKAHIEAQFVQGMNWDNYGAWHMDHIIPCVKFDLSKIDEQKKCFNYTNLQPLWAVDNLRKGIKIA